MSELERAKDYRDWVAVANKLDAFPADVGEGGSRWKADEKSDVYDMVLVKDNHIAAAGGITPVLEAVKAQASHMMKV